MTIVEFVCVVIVKLAAGEQQGSDGIGVSAARFFELLDCLRIQSASYLQPISQLVGAQSGEGGFSKYPALFALLDAP